MATRGRLGRWQASGGADQVPAESTGDGPDREAAAGRVVMTCPACEEAELAPVLWGMPAGPPPAGVVLGGCLPDPQVTHACPGCGWRGFRSRVDDCEVADVESLLDCEDVESLDELEAQLDEHTGLSVVLREAVAAEFGRPGAGTAGVEIVIGQRGIFTPFPFGRAELWADVEFLADVARLEDGFDEDPATEDEADEQPTGREGSVVAGELPPELLTLLQLDPHGEGLERDLVAEVCGWDRDRVLAFIRIGEREVIAWRTSAREAAAAGDAEEAEACSLEGAGWQRTVDDLRKGLRAVVERPGQIQ